MVGARADLLRIGVCARLLARRVFELDTLRRVLTDAGLKADTDEGSALLVHGAAIEVIGDLAARNAITLHELSAPQASLEEAYMNLTDEATEYRSVSQ